MKNKELKLKPLKAVPHEFKAISRTKDYLHSKSAKGKGISHLPPKKRKYTTLEMWTWNERDRLPLHQYRIPSRKAGPTYKAVPMPSFVKKHIS